jgi:diguanylate cyclase (GGDEF)-like protein/PAS domain S-box-containing protein
MLDVDPIPADQDHLLQGAIEAERAHGPLQLANLLAHIPLIVRVIGIDGTYLLSEGQGLRLIGQTPGARVGESLFAVQRNRPDIVALVRRALAGEALHFITELNGYVWESQYTPLYEDGVLIGTLYVAMDITARARAEEALRASEARLQGLLDHTSELLQVTDADGHFDYVNGAWCRTLGYDLDALRGRTMADICAPESWPAYRQGLARLMAGEALPPFETTFLTREGRRVIVAGKLYRDNEPTHPPGAWGTFRDITQQRALEADLRHQATHDALTGLPNRAYFMHRLTDALAMPYLSPAVLFIDLDGFKAINDRFGHAAGDVVLVTTAQRLSRVAPAATVARLGGAEFAILLSHCADDGAAIALAERLAAALAPPIAIGEAHAHIRASIGIARHSVPDEDAEALLGHADAQMYRAKGRGIGGYALAPAR